MSSSLREFALPSCSIAAENTWRCTTAKHSVAGVRFFCARIRSTGNFHQICCLWACDVQHVEVEFAWLHVTPLSSWPWASDIRICWHTSGFLASALRLLPCRGDELRRPNCCTPQQSAVLCGVTRFGSSCLAACRRSSMRRMCCFPRWPSEDSRVPLTFEWCVGVRARACEYSTILYRFTSICSKMLFWEGVKSTLCHRGFAGR